MSPDQKELLVKARDSLKAARVLLDEGFPGFSVSRSYYAMFYLAEAFLEGKGLAFSKHSAVISAFARNFIQTQAVPAEFHRYLLEAMQARHQGDYAPQENITPATAALHIERGEKFLDLALKSLGPISENL